MVSSGRITSRSWLASHARIRDTMVQMVPARGRRSLTTVILVHGMVTSAAAPATTVRCTNDAEVLDGVLSVLDSHEFVFARLVGLANALGCTYPYSPFLRDG
jgi:RNA exonuclease 1